jgi:chromosome partitioning protein
MSARLTVFNQKGGVGKTTTALNLGAALAARGLVPLMMDLDPQAHLSTILAPAGDSGESLFAFYNAGRRLDELARPVSLAGDGAGRLVPGHPELIKVDALFGKGPNILNRLRQGLEAYFQRASAVPVIVDCSPMLGVLSLNSVFATGRVLVPISTDHLAVRGAVALQNSLKALEHVLKRRVERRYVLTRFDGRRRMSHEIAQQLGETFGAELCATRIAESVGLAESPARGMDVFAHAPGSRGAQDYAALLEELLACGFLAV